MIPVPAITAWGLQRPWPNRAAVEQDLLLARTIVAIYEHPLLADEPVFVRRTHAGIGPVLDALRTVAQQVGLQVTGTDITTTPKMRLRTNAENDPTLQLRIKVEINTHETDTARALIRLPFTVDSAWFRGSADVLTFQPAELVATKLRALYQRKKGRDLFDLWLALTEMALDPVDIVDCFAPYRPDGYTAAVATVNLRDKVDNVVFRRDLEPLVGDWPDGYDVDAAAEMVIDRLFALL